MIVVGARGGAAAIQPPQTDGTYHTWDLGYRLEGGGSDFLPHMDGFESAEFAPTMEHVMSRSEFSEFKPQVLEVCRKYWNFGKTLPTWFKNGWPRFIGLVSLSGFVIMIYGITLPKESSIKTALLPIGFLSFVFLPIFLNLIVANFRAFSTKWGANDQAMDQQLFALIEMWNARLAGRGYLVYDIRFGKRRAQEAKFVKELRLYAGNQPPTQLGEPVAMPMDVTVPAGMVPGSQFQATDPATGASFQVTVPGGMAPQTVFQVQPPQQQRATQQIVEKYKGTVALVSATGDHSVALESTQSGVQESPL